MKRNVTLTVTSLLSMLLFTLHISDDIVRGIDRISSANLIGVTIFVVWLYGILTIGDRRSGYVIMLLGSLFAGVPPLAHMITGVSRTMAKSPNGALFFVWTLWALAITANFSVVLSVRGLWRRDWASASERG